MLTAKQRRWGARELSSQERGGFVNYYSAKELAESSRTVRKNTLLIAQEIPEEKYSFRPTPDTRSVGELLSHLALSHKFQHQIQAIERRKTIADFDFPSLLKRIVAEEKEPRTKEQTMELLRTSGEQWAGFLQGLTEDFLAEQVQMPARMTPTTKSRFEMVLSVKEHEMHHRGQLMLMERLIGIVPHMTRDMQARLATSGAAAAAKG
jgi:uncharacterized damage-inducible protein DinB